MAKVTVSIPTYNRAHFLQVAIESVLAQSYSDWELIVCDDGSTDGTADLMASYEGDRRIRYLRHPENIGKSNNMRSGFLAAQGEYFIKFDDDDRLTPEFLARTVAILDQHPELDFVGTDHWIIDGDNQRDEAATRANSRQWRRDRLSPGPIPNLLATVFIHQSLQVGATLFRYSALKAVDFMRQDWQNCEDNDLFVRLALAGKQAYYLPELLMEYRRHPEQNTPARARRYLADKLQYLEAFQFEAANLEQVRQIRLAETRLLLGLRLIEQGETAQGQALLRACPPSFKATLGKILAQFPVGMRSPLFTLLRRLPHS